MSFQQINTKILFQGSAQARSVCRRVCRRQRSACLRGHRRGPGVNAIKDSCFLTVALDQKGINRPWQTYTG